jgi:hypothetical protein
MALVDPAEFEGEETVCVYIARRLSEARGVEEALSAHGVDYTVASEEVVERLLGVLPRSYDAVAFHVRAAQADVSRTALRDTGLDAGLIDED